MPFQLRVPASGTSTLEGRWNDLINVPNPVNNIGALNSLAWRSSGNNHIFSLYNLIDSSYTPEGTLINMRCAALAPAVNTTVYYDTQNDGIADMMQVHAIEEAIQTDASGSCEVAVRTDKTSMYLDLAGNGVFNVVMSEFTRETSAATSGVARRYLNYTTGQWVTKPLVFHAPVHGHEEAVDGGQRS